MQLSDVKYDNYLVDSVTFSLGLALKRNNHIEFLLVCLPFDTMKIKTPAVRISYFASSNLCNNIHFSPNKQNMEQICRIWANSWFFSYFRFHTLGVIQSRGKKIRHPTSETFRPVIHSAIQSWQLPVFSFRILRHGSSSKCKTNTGSCVI